ncbi:hypothetical protein HAZT_HAZT009956 [Hyalella azteca]|uniref:Uncharacterized protein n=1 Tax=Hyalella azteca TaxID=294128 RepID=A0A6A0H8X8_HYAAZ|nr:hypothetical protein HAZT_HAZT009956 [Hyalella azteca]
MSNNIMFHDACSRLAEKPLVREPCASIVPGHSVRCRCCDQLGYDSAVREGFRSRDASPAAPRLAFARSRDSSPLRERLKSPEFKELGGDLDYRSRQNSIRRRDKKPPTGRSVSVDRGYLTKASEINTGASQRQNPARKSLLCPEYSQNSSRSTADERRNYFSCASMTSNEVPVRLTDTHSSINDLINSPLSVHHPSDLDNRIESTKSFIKERIERLYGPGALAVGFSRRSEAVNRTMGNSIKRTPDTRCQGRIIPIKLEYDDQVDNSVSSKEPGRGMPSVFRHLRPEFRYQLPVKSSVASSNSSSGNNSDKFSTNNAPNIREIPVEIETSKASNGTAKPYSMLSCQEDSRTHSNLSPAKENSCDVGVTKKTDVEASVILNNSNHSSNNSSEIRSDSSTNVPHNGCGTSSLRSAMVVETSQSEATVPAANDEKVIKDGHYFLKIVAQEVSELEAGVEQLDKDLEAHGSIMTEEVRGKLLAASGKTKLLISQKIKQFKGLCQKNIAGQQEGEQFPTTCEDLAGFWDMVSLQVEDVRAMHSALAQLRTNGWKEVTTELDQSSSGPSALGGKSRPARRMKAAPPAAMSEAAKAKEDARKKAAEERRKAMREAMKAKLAAAQNTEDNVEIFVPEN